MRVLVLGGYGAVGRYLVELLRADGIRVRVAGRDPSRAEVLVDLREPGLSAYRAALEDADIVVNASGAEELDPVLVATERGRAFVDITASTEYTALLEASEPAAPVLLSVGLAPGLTTLLAAAVHERSPGPIDIAVLLGAGEHHGAAATEWTYGLLGRSFGAGGESVRNFTRPRRFELPGLGRRRMYRTDFADQHMLTRELGVDVHTYFALDSRVATAALALATWIPGAARMPRGLPLPGGDEWIVLARAGSGQEAWARGRGQSRATALLAAAAVRAVADLAPGVRHLHEVVTLAGLPGDAGIETGTRQGAAPA